MSVAVVTGANRGIGLEVTRRLADLGHVVYLGSRDLDAGRAAAAALHHPDLVHPIELDVGDRSTLDAAARRIADEHGNVDIVVNNAAIHYDSNQTASDPDLTIVGEALDVNLFGAWNTILAFADQLTVSGSGRIVNVSSGAGALTDMGAGLPAYRLSKVGLNALTRMFAAELGQAGVLVNSVCPGWVATDMGGSGGRPVEDGAAGVVWAATLPDTGPTGGFFRDCEPIPW